MIKIAITGPESSGKSTLTVQLAKQFKVSFFTEFARTYLVQKAGRYDLADLTQIALQQDLQRQVAKDERLAFYDTENLVIYIWSKVKYGKVDPAINTLLEQQEFTHYFLCRPDIPWESDELRENPHNREELFEIYRSELDQRSLPYTIIEGSTDERLAKAITEVEALIEASAK